MMMLRDMFENIDIQGKVFLYSVDDDRDIVDSREVQKDGIGIPQEFADFADCFVKYMFPSNGGIVIGVDAPADTEIYYTGGGIDCAVHKLPDGTWFSGATNEFGCIYSTRQAAIDSFGDDENLLRYVEDLEEQKKIWRDIYKTEIERGGDYADECRKWLVTLDADLSSMWAG